ncbi:MAG TPA: hypothetical protein VI670_23540 [Thermoanaerobaculia bacterium]|jgi:hypothetical protein
MLKYGAEQDQTTIGDVLAQGSTALPAFTPRSSPPSTSDFAVDFGPRQAPSTQPERTYVNPQIGK